MKKEIDGKVWVCCPNCGKKWFILSNPSENLSLKIKCKKCKIVIELKES